jgi:hypothetical protein
MQMDSEQQEKDWKLRLRYGQLKTAFTHYTVLAEGIVGQLTHGFSCPPGNAYMGMKTWASSEDESADMLVAIGKEIGFTVKGSIQIYKTEPFQPPRENAFGYDIKFTPFRAEDENRMQD